MNYCVNPACGYPENPARAKVCHFCESTLLLRDRYHSATEVMQALSLTPDGDSSTPVTEECSSKVTWRNILPNGKRRFWI
ncbi:MAG TPA: 4-Cys prefix domain-containing protein [Candidatus Sericytochromatia bacterium]|jgi:hypothetical protein